MISPTFLEIARTVSRQVQPNSAHEAKVRYCVQICSSSLSCFGSALIMMMVACSPPKFESPYHRIMFGMAFVDIAQSLALVVGPFAPAKGDPFAPWAIGNVHTCEANGFFFLYGKMCASFYLLLLCCHLFCRITRRMSNAEFAKRYEWKAHCFIHGFTLLTCIVALVLDNFNSLRGGACMLARYPTGCWLDQYKAVVGECTLVLTALNMMLVLLLIKLICMVTSIFLLFKLYLRVRNIERMMTHESGDGGGRNSVISTRGSNNEFEASAICADDTGIDVASSAMVMSHITSGVASASHVTSGVASASHVTSGVASGVASASHVTSGVNPSSNTNTNILGTEDRIRTWRREAVIQAILYVTIFFISNIAVVIFQLEAFTFIEPHPLLKLILINGLYPMLGFFNLIIYVRPKVAELRLQDDQLSWIKAFFFIVRARGDMSRISRNDTTSNDSTLRQPNTNLMRRIFCCNRRSSLSQYDGLSDVRPRQSDSQGRGPPIPPPMLSGSHHISEFFTSLFDTERKPKKSLHESKNERIKFDALQNNKITNNSFSDVLPDISST